MMDVYVIIIQHPVHKYAHLLKYIITLIIGSIYTNLVKIGSFYVNFNVLIVLNASDTSHLTQP